MEADEPPRRAATRELSEETTVTVAPDDVDFLDTAFVEHPNDEYVLVVVYVTERAATSDDPTPKSDAGNARFWRLNELTAAGESIEPGYRELFERAIAGMNATTNLRRD